jgi:hypothetical protein
MLNEIRGHLAMFGLPYHMNFMKDDAIREMQALPGLRMAAGDHEVYSWNSEKGAWNICDGGSATLTPQAFEQNVMGPFRIMEDFA